MAYPRAIMKYHPEVKPIMYVEETSSRLSYHPTYKCTDNFASITTPTLKGQCFTTVQASNTLKKYKIHIHSILLVTQKLIPDSFQMETMVLYRILFWFLNQEQRPTDYHAEMNQDNFTS